MRRFCAPADAPTSVAEAMACSGHLARRSTYAGVFLVAAATLVLEILLTRITSVVAWYHLAFFVISLAMLGMTAGAVAVFVKPAWFPDDKVGTRMAQASVLFALGTPLSMILALAIPLTPIADIAAFFAMLAFGGVLALPFAIGGIVLTLALTRAKLPEGIVYGVDLVGAASGCALVIPLLAFVDAPSAVFVAASAAALAGAMFARADATHEGVRLRRRAVFVAAFLLGAGIVNVVTGGAVLRPRWIKGMPEVPELYEWVGWNTYSRVTVDHTLTLPPAFWAPGRGVPHGAARADPAACDPHRRCGGHDDGRLRHEARRRQAGIARRSRVPRVGHHLVRAPAATERARRRHRRGRRSRRARSGARRPPAGGRHRAQRPHRRAARVHDALVLRHRGSRAA